MIRNIILTLGTRVLVSMGNLLLVMAIARALGPEGQGIVSFLVMMAGLLVLGGSLGLDAAGVYYLNRMGVGASAYRRRVLPAMALSFGLLGGGVILLDRLGHLGTPSTQGPGLLLAMLALAALDMVIALVRFQYMARERIKEYNSIEFVQAVVLYSLVGGTLLVRQDSPLVLLCMYGIDRLFTLAYLGWRAAKRPLDSKESPVQVAPPLRSLLAFSLFPWLANLFSMLNVRLDSILVAWFISQSDAMNSADLGLYTVCMLAVARLTDLQAAIQVSFYPRAASLRREEALVLTSQFYRRSGPAYLLLFGAILLGGWPVLWLFGPEYPAAFPTLVTLAFGVICVRANSGVLSIFFTAQGKPALPALVNATGVLISPLLGFLLIPRLGIQGAALATVGASLATKGLLVWLFLREGVRYRRDMVVSKADFEDMWKMVRRLMLEHPRSPWCRTAHGPTA